jgi:SAM-dependent methyltransferase
MNYVSDNLLRCAYGHGYPVLEGVPVLLRDDVVQTQPLAWASIARARFEQGSTDERNPHLFLESMGVSEEEKKLVIDLAGSGKSRIDPVVSVLIAATCGNAYKKLIGVLDHYPIPDLRLPPGEGKVLLDIGCNWGRWSIAAARKGYKVIGIDPSLSAIMAARRVASELDLDIEYIVADARYLPFEQESIDNIFSYSVLQHFSKPDAICAISEIARTLKFNGHCLIQMAHAFGLRSLYHQLRCGFRKNGNFSVRYWTIPELRDVFREKIGPVKFSVDCYFGLGLQPLDKDIMHEHVTWIIKFSEWLRSISLKVPALTYFADSVYVSAVKVSAGKKK